MILMLGTQGLNHDRVRLAMAAGGFALAMMLVAIQRGLIAGFTQMISARIDLADAAAAVSADAADAAGAADAAVSADAGLWLVPTDTAVLDDPALPDTDAELVRDDLATKPCRKTCPTGGFDACRVSVAQYFALAVADRGGGGAAGRRVIHSGQSLPIVMFGLCFRQLLQAST